MVDVAGVMQGKHLVIHGRVQGVFYRDSMRQAAAERGIFGWCRNRPEGTVEGEIWGSPEAVSSMLDWCHQGPPMAEVSHVDVTDLPVAETVSTPFEIRR